MPQSTLHSNELDPWKLNDLRMNVCAFPPSIHVISFQAFRQYAYFFLIWEIQFDVHRIPSTQRRRTKIYFFFSFQNWFAWFAKTAPVFEAIWPTNLYVRSYWERTNGEWRCSTVAALIPTNTADSLCGPKKNLKSHHRFVRVHIVNNHHSITGRFVWCLKLHTLLLLSYCGRVAAVSNRHHSWCYFLISKWYNQTFL